MPLQGKLMKGGRPAECSVVSGVVGAACIGGAGIAQGKAAGNVVNASSTILHDQRLLLSCDSVFSALVM